MQYYLFHFNVGYHGASYRRITKLFEDTNFRIAFRTNNTVHKFLKPTAYRPVPTYEDTGVCERKWPDCSEVHIGQMLRNLKTRFQENVRDIKNNL
jgi:hypothetical protein